MIDTSLLEKIIVGRVEPHIYAFTTNTIPNYLKVGDTYRPVSVRLDEWKRYYPGLTKQYEEKVDAEIALSFLSYNIRRAAKLIGTQALLAHFRLKRQGNPQFS